MLGGWPRRLSLAGGGESDHSPRWTARENIVLGYRGRAEWRDMSDFLVHLTDTRDPWFHTAFEVTAVFPGESQLEVCGARGARTHPTHACTHARCLCVRFIVCLFWGSDSNLHIRHLDILFLLFQFYIHLILSRIYNSTENQKTLVLPYNI